jgi:hypothetical protein
LAVNVDVESQVLTEDCPLDFNADRPGKRRAVQMARVPLPGMIAHKRETTVPVRVALSEVGEAVVLKEMIEIGAPGGRVERDEGSRREQVRAGAKQAGEAGQLCKIRGVVEFVRMGSARICNPLFFKWSGLGVEQSGTAREGPI